MYSSNTKCAEVADKLKCLKGLTAEEIVKAWIPYQDVYPAWNADEITDLPIRNERFGNLAIVDGKNEMVIITPFTRSKIIWMDLCQNVPRLKRTHVRTYSPELKRTQYKVRTCLGWIIAFN